MQAFIFTFTCSNSAMFAMVLRNISDHMRRDANTYRLIQSSNIPTSSTMVLHYWNIHGPRQPTANEPSTWLRIDLAWPSWGWATNGRYVTTGNNLTATKRPHRPSQNWELWYLLRHNLEGGVYFVSSRVLDFLSDGFQSQRSNTLTLSPS